MKSITIRIDDDLLEAIDARVGPDMPRSRVIRDLLRSGLQPRVVPPPKVSKVKGTVERVPVPKVERPDPPGMVLYRDDVEPRFK